MKDVELLKFARKCARCSASELHNPLDKKKLRKLKIDFRINNVPKKDEIRILFIGQPNVGKSSLLNALVGTKIKVSNYPGTSVELMEAEKIITLYIKNKAKIQKIKYIFKDTPGIYSISDRSAEESITKKSIFQKDYDIIIIIVDATALERGLYFTLQVLESGLNVVLGINFIEDAYKKGITINNKKLNHILGIPVINFNPITKNIEELIITATNEICKPSKKYFSVKYDDHIEELIDFILKSITSDLSKRFVSVRILEEDPDFINLLPNDKKQILTEKKRLIAKEHLNIKEDISKQRYGTSAYISEKVTRIHKIEKLDKTKKPFLDKVLLHRIWGPFLTLIFFLGLLFVLLAIGGQIEELLIGLGDIVIELIPKGGWSIGNFSFLNLLREGLAGAFAGIAIAFPYILLFYLILGVIEDIGILPRFVVNIQKIFNFLGLPSKGLISMILGLGCTVPAYSSTRIINRKPDRLKIALMFSFIPCSSRIGIIMGIVGFFGGYLLSLAIFLTLIGSMLIWAFIIKWLTKGPLEPMLIELPPYRCPVISNVFSKSWLRMKGFVKIVIPLLIGGGIIYSLLDQIGVTTYFVELLGPIIELLFGLPGETIIPIVFGFIQKDLTGAMLMSALGTENGLILLTNIQLYTFGVITSIGVPCVIALGIMFKEYGIKNSLIIFISVLLYNILIASISWRIAILFI